MRLRLRLLIPLSAALIALAGAGTAVATNSGQHRQARSASTRGLPIKAMEAALQVQGMKRHGVESFGFDRTDINNVKIGSVPMKPAFMINGEFDFQSIGHGRAFMNGDLPVKPDEINRVIDAIVNNGLVFQAEHQHMYDFNPIIFFIHVRGEGNPVKLARALHKVLKATSIPLPQSSPSNPKTPLDAKRLKKILHGFAAEVGDDGVVTVYVARRNAIHIDGIKVNPSTNIATNIGFEPLNASGTDTAVIPDYGMQAGEIDRLMRFTRKRGWDIGCLYNQETDEHPQLFFSHQFKTGNPYELAAEIRAALNLTNTR